jgi:hypothetical protein
MTEKSKSTRLLAVSTVCVLGSLAVPAGTVRSEDVVRLAASDSFWCRMVPSLCANEGTPGGAQNVAEPPASAPAVDSARGMDSAPAADGGTYETVVPPESPPPKLPEESPAPAQPAQ